MLPGKRYAILYIPACALPCLAYCCPGCKLAGGLYTETARPETFNFNFNRTPRNFPTPQDTWHSTVTERRLKKCEERRKGKEKHAKERGFISYSIPSLQRANSDKTQTSRQPTDQQVNHQQIDRSSNQSIKQSINHPQTARLTKAKQNDRRLSSSPSPSSPPPPHPPPLTWVKGQSRLPSPTRIRIAAAKSIPWPPSDR